MSDNRKDIEKKEARLEHGVERTRDRRVYSPAVDIVERNDDILLTADVPGVDEKSIDITLEKNLLTLYGTIEADIPDALKLGHAEYGVGDYHRTFTLSDEVDRDRISASVKNGVLKLVLPKSERMKTRRIDVAGEA
jgi:HSP20 family molecular chaperone IbpA